MTRRSVPSPVIVQSSADRPDRNRSKEPRIKTWTLSALAVAGTDKDGRVAKDEFMAAMGKIMKNET